MTVGAPTTPLGVTSHFAWFWPNGRFITSTEAPCVGTVDHPWIARADGTGLRAVPAFGYYTIAGAWLYSGDAQGIYRQHDLDDEPQLIVRSSATGLTRRVPSPDGEAIEYCEVDPSAGNVPVNCHVESPVGATPVAISSPRLGYTTWSSDGSWLLEAPCTVYDRASNSVWSCDSASLAQPLRTFTDDNVFAFVTHDADGFEVHVRTVATGEENVLPPLPWLPGLKMTPDHTTVIASTVDFAAPWPNPFPILAAPTHGGPWTTLADDVVPPVDIAPYGSIVIMTSVSKGIVASIAGGPVHPLSHPGLRFRSGPFFEPPGGLDKVIFEADDGKVSYNVVGNVDGTGDWVRLPPDLYCWGWTGHLAWCAGRGQGEVLGVPDNGNAAQVIATGIMDIGIAPSALKIFYIDPAGLHGVDNLRP